MRQRKYIHRRLGSGLYDVWQEIADQRADVCLHQINYREKKNHGKITIRQNGNMSKL